MEFGLRVLPKSIQEAWAYWLVTTFALPVTKLDFVGVGLFYKKGYFAQSVIGGRQVAGWPDYFKRQCRLSC